MAISERENVISPMEFHFRRELVVSKMALGEVGNVLQLVDRGSRGIRVVGRVDRPETAAMILTRRFFFHLDDCPAQQPAAAGPRDDIPKATRQCHLVRHAVCCGSTAGRARFSLTTQRTYP
jgi:hypothetical protein